MYRHILQYFYRLAGSLAFQAFWAIHYEWDVITWLGFSLIMVSGIYVMDAIWIFISETTGE